MLKNILLISVLVSCGVAKPSDNFWPKNVVTVPPNCPVGQEWVNGQCRDIWRNVFNAAEHVPEAQKISDSEWPHNVITVPSNCRPGQQWINGQCRDVWKLIDATPVNVVTVPPNCPTGQEYVNGECRDIWNRAPLLLEKLVYSNLDTTKGQSQSDEEMADEIGSPLVGSADRNIINVPNHCPVGFKPDALGFCRPIFGEAM